MADSPDLPGERAWRVGPDGRLPLEYWKFLRDLTTYVRQTRGNTASLSEIDARLDALESAGANAVTGQNSVNVSQQDAETIIRLVGDLAVPGAGRYYGTSSDGTRGWYERLLSTLSDVDFTTPPATGDALVYDGANWAPAQVSTPQIFSRITADGDVRITADGDIRITD
jgi:hypothetical protein